MSRRDYGTYRGRRTATDVLKFVVALLAVLLALAIAALLIGQRYIVYTDDGVRLELPFFRRGEQQPSGDGSQPIKIVEVPDASQPAQPEPEPEPEPEFWMRAVFLTLEELDNGGIQAARDAGANTVVLDMKPDSGRLNYVSQLPLAKGADTDLASPAVEALHQAGLRAVARVSCFRDNSLGNNAEYAILTNSGYRWCYDDVKLYWTSPTNLQVQEYLAGVAAELAALGFDEILLDNCGYPTQGQLGWIRRGEAYDPARLSEVMDAFLTQVAQALEGSETVLSVNTSAQVLSGTDKLSGQTAGTLERLCGRLWLSPGGEDDLVELARQAGITDPEHRLVTMGETFTQGESHQCLNGAAKDVPSTA